MKKILVITNIPNPYRIPLFAELNRQMKDQDMQLKVVFAAMGYKRRQYKIDLDDCGFDFEVLPSGVYTSAENSEITYFDYKGLWQLVNKENPYRCIIAGFSSGTMQLYFRSFLKQTPFIIWSGSVKKRGRNDNFLRKIQRHFIAKRASAFVAYGYKAKEYLIEELGVKPEKVAIARNTIDTSFFSKSAGQNKDINPAEGRKHLLHIGYLVPRKNIKLLFPAIDLLRNKRSDFILDIVGDGESMDELKRKVQELKLEEFVTFHGYKQKDELPPFMARSSVFLFQTDFDIWGLTLNESMAAGLPCICSPNAGAATDLIEDGETGWIIDYHKPELVAEKVNFLLDHPDVALSMGLKAKQKVESIATLKISAAGFIEAVRISEKVKR